MKKTLLTLAVTAVLALSAGQADAQLRFGGQLSFGSESDFGIGARTEFGLESLYENLFGIASLDYFFIDCPSSASCSYIELNANAALPIPLEGSPLNPYVGAGLHLARAAVSVGDISNSDSEIGLNLLAGSKFPAEGRRWTPFAELRLGISGGEQLVISGGILF